METPQQQPAFAYTPPAKSSGGGKTLFIVAAVAVVAFIVYRKLKK